jgi:hypothetical protein
MGMIMENKMFFVNGVCEKITEMKKEVAIPRSRVE